ncbi:MAG: hypothetical protein GFH24_608416n23 [Chloroflexi bacterium AL-N5]|nr:hypothetical protein [Chloroflexi bacterium AL-N5]
MTVALRLFGQACWHDRMLRPSRPAALLVYLAHRQVWVSRDELALLFYPEATEQQAATNLRQLIKRSKDLVRAGSVEVEADCLRFSIDTDVQHFRQAIGRADWAKALALYDSFLPGFEQDIPSFDTWLELERTALEQVCDDALRRYLEVLEASCSYDEAALLLNRSWQKDSLREDLAQQLMRFLYQSGKREEALKVFSVLETQLMQELALTPLEETFRLVETIRNAQPISAVAGARSKFTSKLIVPDQTSGREQIINALYESQAQLIVLFAVAGMGKSHLLTLLAQDAVWLRGREGLESVPFYPLSHLLKTQPPSELASAKREVLAHFVPEIFAGLPAPLDALTAKAKVLDAWLAYLQAISSAGRFQIVIDDLQWLDSATMEMLAYLMHTSSLRVMVAYRSDELPEAYRWQLDALSSVRDSFELLPLDPTSVQRLIASLAGLAEGPPRFAQWLQRHTGGNPLFILETLRLLQEQGLLSTEGVWSSQLDTISETYSEFVVPAKVNQIILRRIERLSGACQRLLSILAVEPSLSAEQLASLSGLSLWSVVEGLSEAEQKGLLASRGFQHDVLQQSVYRSLSAAKQRVLHSQIAGFLRDPHRVAWHYFQAMKYHESLLAYVQAARNLAQNSRFHEARLVLEQALKALTGKHDISLLKAELAFAVFHLGEFSEAQHLAEDVLGSSRLAEAAALSQVVLAYLAIEVMDISVAEGYYQSAIALPDIGETVARYIRWLKYPIFSFSGRSHEIIDEVEAELSTLKAAGRNADYLLFLANRGILYYRMDDYSTAFELSLEAIREAKRLRSVYYQQLAAMNLADPALKLGRLAEAVALSQEALEQGSYAISSKLRANLAVMLEQQGKTVEAFTAAEQVLREEPNLWLRHVLLSLQVRCSTGPQRHAVLTWLLALLAEPSPGLDEAISTVRQYGEVEHIAVLENYLSENSPGK